MSSHDVNVNNAALAVSHEFNLSPRLVELVFKELAARHLAVHGLVGGDPLASVEQLWARSSSVEAVRAACAALSASLAEAGESLPGLGGAR